MLKSEITHPLAQAAAEQPSQVWGWVVLVVGALIALGLAALVIGALVSLYRAEADGTTKAVWVLIVVMAPLLGAALWFVIGRSQARKNAVDSRPESGPAQPLDGGQATA